MGQWHSQAGQVGPKIKESRQAFRLPGQVDSNYLFNFDIEAIKKFLIVYALGLMLFLYIFFSPILFPPSPLMTSQGCCQLYCYSKDPFMN